MRSNRQTLKPDAGLTLLELLVVVTILTLLVVSIGTVAINYLGSSKAQVARVQLTQLEAGLDLFRLDMGRYPEEGEGLRALVEAPGGVEGWNGPYLRKEAALTDPWGEEFQYAAPGRAGPYDLYSLGADKAEGGEDDASDITNW